MIAYYPGCSLSSGSGREYGISCEAVMKELKIEYREISDWNCCGASALHNYDENLALAASYRNLAIAEKVSNDLVAPCSSCFNRLKTVSYCFEKSKEKREWLMDKTGITYSGKVNVEHFAGLMLRKEIEEKIKKQLKVPLKNLKIAVYYSCLLIRPVEVSGFDDPNNPTKLDDFVAKLGATPLDWPYKTECCGAGFSISKPEISNELTYKILSSAKKMGADCILTVCPLCQSNLDLRQKGIEKKFGTKIDMPILYISQLVALSLGISPDKLGLSKHSVDPMRMIKNKFPIYSRSCG